MVPSLHVKRVLNVWVCLWYTARFIYCIIIKVTICTLCICKTWHAHSHPCEEVWGLRQDAELLKSPGNKVRLEAKTRSCWLNLAITHLFNCTVTHVSISNISFIADTRPLRGQQETAGLHTPTVKQGHGHRGPSFGHFYQNKTDIMHKTSFTLKKCKEFSEALQSLWLGLRNDDWLG